jgi:hypothetical protein
MADPGDRADKDLGLRPFAYWKCGFESRRWHGYVSLVSEIFCQVEISASADPPSRGVLPMFSYLRNLTQNV